MASGQSRRANPGIVGLNAMPTVWPKQLESLRRTELWQRLKELPELRTSELGAYVMGDESIAEALS